MKNFSNKNNKTRIIIFTVLILFAAVIISYIIALFISSLMNPSTAEIIKSGGNEWVKSGGMKNQFLLFLSSWIVTFLIVFGVFEMAFLYIINKFQRAEEPK
jgi:hypothetical protein